MGDDLEPRRRQIADALESGRLAAQVYDDRGRLWWVSEQMRELAGADPTTDVGYGMSVEEGVELPVWRTMLPERSRRRLRVELGARLGPDLALEGVWVSPLELSVEDRIRPIGMLGFSLRAEDGTLVATVLLFAPLLSARVLALVSDGDEAMFARIADLAEPGRRPAAVVFADIDSSGPLARSLPTPAFFELIRGFTSAFDDLVARHGGIVGKHAGDGASAFFLAGAAGESSAVAAALSFAREFPEALDTVVRDLADGGVGLERCRVNIAAHWGANLFLGQIVTGGRLEVTAIGDEVTEAARIGEVATGGQTLVSKTLVERLDDAAAAALAVEPLHLTYRLLADLAGDRHPKARRDAGAIPVADLTGLSDLADHGDP